MLHTHRRYEHGDEAYLVPVEKVVQRPFTDDFEVKQEIGRGGYGICTVVKQPRTRRFFVAKVIKCSKYRKEDDRKFLFNEIRLQANLNHKNIVSLDKVYVENGMYTLITELCFYGCLDALIAKKRDSLGEGERRHLIHGMLCGGRYLHSKYIVHGDIKPQNIFVSKGLTAKIGDFGMAHYQEQEDCFGGTLNYFAPEMFRTADERHTTKTDVWAIGCTAFYIYTGESLFAHSTRDSTPQIRRQISLNVRHKGWNKLPIEVRNFLSLLTNRRPSQRPECSSLVRHPFLMRRIKRAVSTKVLLDLAPCIFDPDAPPASEKNNMEANKTCLC